jgi:hypothetical protein
MALTKKYNKGNSFSDIKNVEQEQAKLQANTPSGHANIKNIAKGLAVHVDEAISVILQVMRDQNAKPSERLGAAKYIVNETINSLGQMDRQKLMAKQIALMDTKIKESDMRVIKVEDETPSGDDVTESNVVAFSTELMLVQ